MNRVERTSTLLKVISYVFITCAVVAAVGVVMALLLPNMSANLTMYLGVMLASLIGYGLLFGFSLVVDLLNNIAQSNYEIMKQLASSDADSHPDV